MIKRHIPISMKGSALSRFCVLLLGQGFTRAEFQGVRQQVWELLKRRCDVFANVDRPGLPESGSIAIFYDSETILDLGITQSGRTLTMSSAGHAALGAFLAMQTVRDDNGQTVRASDVWTSGGRRGATGAVVLVVVKGSAEGDLYELTPSEVDRTPVAGAVLVQTQHWTNVLARAMGQMIASLAEEYSLSDADHDKAPETIFGPFPNLVRVTDTEKLALARGDKPTEVIRCFGPAWEKFPLATFKYYPFAGQTEHGMGLYEGGITFRQNILRSNFDCLLKRIPFESGTKTIQSDVRFCPVCQEALHLALGRLRNFELPRARKRQGTQRLEYDMVHWGDTEKIEPLPMANRPIASPSPQGPKWNFKLSASPVVGLRLTDVNLSERPGDPFAAAEEAFKTIEFTDLKVKFKGEPETTLRFADAFANTIDKPRLVIAGPGAPGLYQHGIKLSLTWGLTNKYLIDVTLSVVLRGERNDFDPGGTAAACKAFPQISMRYRPRTKGYPKSTARLPAIEYLTGTIRIEANNIIPKNIVIPPGLPSGEEAFLKNHMALGTLRAAYVTDSNTSHLDSSYEDSASVANFIPGKKPPWGILYRGRWQSGRKLAHVVNPALSPVGDTWDIGAGTARFGFVRHKGPLLPNWSWLFDYIDTNIATKKTVVGAYTLKEKVVLRSALVDWPPAVDVNDGDNHYQMRIEKQPRQGAYDNIHLHPEMLEHEPPREHQPLITAPFCAEKCVHLHWRWGTSGINSLSTPYEFLGWDDVGSSAVAHVGRGLPLIPPNQHLDVTVDPLAPDTISGKPTRVEVLYAVRAYEPQATEQQVFLEQGVGFAYRYSIGAACAPSINDFSLLMAVVGALPAVKSTSEIDKETLRLNTARDNGPLYDAYLREDFHKIYSKIRFYDKERDDVKSDNVQQVPAGPVPVPAEQPPGAPKLPLNLETL
jgi:hypothetical protein